MSLRNVALASAVVGVPLCLAILFAPFTWGYAGYWVSPYGPQWHFIYVDPGSQAYREGVRVGEPLEPLEGYNNVLDAAGPTGSVVHLDVIRNGRSHSIAVTFTPFPPALMVQERISKVVTALTALAAFVVTLLVGFRARNRQLGARAVGVVACVAWLAATGAGKFVAPSVWVALSANVLEGFFAVCALCNALALLAAFPPNPDKLRRTLARIAPWLLLGGVLLTISTFMGQWNSHPHFGLYFEQGELARWILTLLLAATVAVSSVDAMLTVDEAHRTPARWLGGCWLIGALLAVAWNFSAVTGIGALVTHTGDILYDAVIVLFAFGVGYPVLRHRLVDLNVVISRASTFAAVSLAILALFIIAEWFVSVLFGRVFGAAYANGTTQQTLTLLIVLVLGISARSIHQVIENWLGRFFFRKKLQGIADIRRVAREADASTDASAVAQLACETAASGLEPLGVACYLRRGDGYTLKTSSGTMPFQPMYGFNDAVPLRLRRWQEPFELDDTSEQHNHVLFLPMTLHSELLGFLCCGPKPDRTHYLKDEVEALALLAHQVGIATAWLEPLAMSARPVASVYPVASSP